jgi:predicted outer membrane repeat protein
VPYYGKWILDAMKRTALLLLLCFLVGVGQAQVIYVNHAATGANDGTSWVDAFVFLQDALAVAHAGDDIWVAEGVHRPDEGAALVRGDRQASFLMPPAVRVFGGFEGSERTVSERPQSLYTFLSGDLLGNDLDSLVVGDPTRQDNSYTVVEYPELTRPPPTGDRTLLDGFVVSGGFSDGPVHREWAGGGLFLGYYSSPTIRNVVLSDNFARDGGGAYKTRGAARFVNCVFSGNLAAKRGGAIYVTDDIRLDSSMVAGNRAVLSGGGMYFVGSENPGAATNSTFFANVAGGDGGGVTNRFRSPLYVNIRFIGNSARGGGAVSNDDAQARFVNVVFSGNSATSAGSWGEGGAMANHSSTVSIVNATFSGNSAVLPGTAIASWYSETDVVNSIFWSSSAFTLQAVDVEGDASSLTMWNSVYQGTLPDRVGVTGPILDSDPRFLNPAGPDGLPGTLDDDFGLSPASPAINAGDAAFILADLADLDGDGDRSEPMPFDLAGSARVQGGQVDMGAYEAPASTSRTLPPVLTSARECTLDIFPSPFGHEVTLSFQSADRTGLGVFDVLGRSVFTRSILPGTRTLTVGTSNWMPGMFFFRATNAAESCSGLAVHQ